MTVADYPSWVCLDCGDKHGRRPVGIATWHMGTCDICGEAEMVTEPRDWGHLRETWRAEAEIRRAAE